MQFRTTTLSTAFRTVPRRLTHGDSTHSPPEWRSTWPSQTASAESWANDEKVISDKTTTEKAESENVVAESVSAQQVSTETEVVEKAAEEKVTIAKSTVANVAVEEVTAKTNSSTKTITAKQVFRRRASKLRKRIRTRRRYSRMYQGTLDRQRLEEERKHAGFLGGVSW